MHSTHRRDVHYRLWLVASGDLNHDGFARSDSRSVWCTEPANQQASGAIYVYFGANVRPPEITKAKFKDGMSLPQIIGTDLTGSVRIEINGVIINREVTCFVDEGRLVLKGTRQQLTLRSDPNQVVVIRKGSAIQGRESKRIAALACFVLDSPVTAGRESWESSGWEKARRSSGIVRNDGQLVQTCVVEDPSNFFVDALKLCDILYAPYRLETLHNLVPQSHSFFGPVAPDA